MVIAETGDTQCLACSDCSANVSHKDHELTSFTKASSTSRISFNFPDSPVKFPRWVHLSAFYMSKWRLRKVGGLV